MDAVEFIKAYWRMCDDCDKCPLDKLSKKMGYCECFDIKRFHPDKCVKVVEKWAAKHPETEE